jgi:4-amino-4-deoxychorismate lyase
VALFDGKQWLTPARPLLRGTQRERLISEGLVNPADIRVDDLAHFEKVRIINAMIRFEDRCDIPVNRLAH